MGASDEIAIVATGPSVRQHREFQGRVIAVNGAIELVMPAIWFTLDLSPQNWAYMAAPREGVRYVVAASSRSLRGRHLPEHVSRLRRIESVPAGVKPIPGTAAYWCWRWRAMLGLSEDVEAIHTGNSAYGALGLAYHLRPRVIRLYGVDGTQEARATGGTPERLDHLPLLFASAKPQLQAAGIRVINCSRQSKVTCFEYE